MKALILIVLLTFISCDTGDYVSGIDSLTYKCPDEKLKLKDDLCAIYVEKQEADSSGIYKASSKVLYIKKKCGKNNHCREYYSDTLDFDSKNREDVEYYTCFKEKLSL